MENKRVSGGTGSIKSKRREEQILHARKRYVQEVQRNIARQQRHRELVERIDERVRRARDQFDASLAKRRRHTDEKLKESRHRIEERYIRGNPDKAARFRTQTQKTDRYLAGRRSREDEQIAKRRTRMAEGNKRYSFRWRKLYRNVRKRALGQLRSVERTAGAIFISERTRVIFLAALVVLVLGGLLFTLIRQGILRKKYRESQAILVYGMKAEWIEEENLPEKQVLWNALMEHFDGNETAVLGVMCNLNAESDFRAGNLENLNNKRWDVTDEEYTSLVNTGVVTREDFIKSRFNGETKGKYIGDHVWKNVDGGYGYAQCTAYEKKTALFDYAEAWYDIGGPGEEMQFNIASPTMQAHFIVSLLESDEYRSLDLGLKNSYSITDACYLWLRYYEIPADPYKDSYKTLAFKRSECAKEILEFCKRTE